MEWVFLRGLTRESRHWGNFGSFFEKQIPDSKILYVDLPGVGTRNNERCPSLIAAIADQVRSQIPPPEAGKKRYLLAISLGGMVGMDWMSRFPDEFAGAVIMNSSAGNLSPAWQRMLPINLPFLFRAFFMRDIGKRERRILSSLVNLLKGENFERVAKEWLEIAQTRPVKRHVALRQIRAAKHFRAPQIHNIPMLFLTSKKDRMVSWKCSKILAKHFGGSLQCHESAGHDLPIDDPQWIVEQIVQWLPQTKSE